MAKEYPEDIQKLLKSVYDECVLEDRATRERQIRSWKRLKLIWEGFTQVWYSEVAHDWRIWDSVDTETDQASYDKPINIFRAYLESIIAALSIVTPKVKSYPDDADNPLDLITARAGDKIYDLVSRHNESALLWLHILYIYCTEGMIATYTYPHESEEYGTYENNEYEDVEQSHEITSCSLCGQVLQDQQLSEDIKDREINEFEPGAGDVKLMDAIQGGQDLCPYCMQMMDPELTTEKFVVTRLVDTTTDPKTRIMMEAYGGLYIKVPNYARKQSDCPYLIYSYETNYASALYKYQHLTKNEKLKKQINNKSTNGYSQYDAWGRLNLQYQNEYPMNVVTCNTIWIRPSQFYVLSEEDAKKLEKLFPFGAKCVFINDVYAEACPEKLDDHWTLNYNPLADYITYNPLGLLLVSVQEITNDLISLILQTIEHGIGMTFADPKVLNFKAFEKQETTPGGVFPATAKSGKSLQDGFMELRTAILSSEVLPFLNNIQSLGQVASGALPSLWGGALEGSETASQYSMSSANARQRLQNIWTMTRILWKNTWGKAIPMYMKMVQHDEKEVTKDNDGNFINVFIRKSEMEGKIGRVELEANENLPYSWSQIRDTFMKLVELNNPQVMSILTDPNNLEMFAEYLGLDDLTIPGWDDREKQFNEIKGLLSSAPLPTDDPMLPEVASIDIDPMYDNHQVHFTIIKKWLTSEAGQQAKVTNANGFKNVALHGKMHLLEIQQSIPIQSTSADDGVKSGRHSNEAPITENDSAPTIS